MGRGQSWSFDALLGVLIFLLAIIAFFYITSYTGRSERLKTLTAEGELLSKKLLVAPNSTELAFLKGNKVDSDKLVDFANKSYDEIRKELGLVNDFCIHFEDENGNLINISIQNGSDVYQKSGIGSGRFQISGSNCS